jgi:hypothetical protein
MIDLTGFLFDVHVHYLWTEWRTVYWHLPFIHQVDEVPINIDHAINCKPVLGPCGITVSSNSRSPMVQGSSQSSTAGRIQAPQEIRLLPSQAAMPLPSLPTVYL